MRERARSMRMRVLSRLAVETFPQHDLDLVDEALSAALSARDETLDDDHDVDLLHPARTLLILIDDVGVRDCELLRVGALLESERADLAAYGLLEQQIATPLTVADPGELLESLLALPAPLAEVALAERLDQARHLHLRPRTMWPSRLALEEAVYLPLSTRHPGLMARRYARWHASFVERRQ